MVARALPLTLQEPALFMRAAAAAGLLGELRVLVE